MMKKTSGKKNTHPPNDFLARTYTKFIMTMKKNMYRINHILGIARAPIHYANINIHFVLKVESGKKI